MSAEKIVNVNPTFYFHPNEIRTSNMLPDRSSDVDNAEPSLTQQQFAKECDINYIVRANQATGFLPNVNSRPAQYGDLGESTDYHTAMNYVAEANSAFAQLPADVRFKFKNDPALMLDFLNDDKNYDEALKLGLVNKRPDPEPDPEPALKTPAKPVSKVFKPRSPIASSGTNGDEEE